MKRVIAVAAALVLVLLVLPVLLIAGPSEAEDKDAASTLPVLPALPTPARVEDLTFGEADSAVTVRLALKDGEVVELAMADYLWSVVSAEMPASFEPEALKAQAVTARTYTVWKMSAGEANHPEADVCTDINCCQAWISREAAEAGWGTEASEYTEKIRSAVAETDGEIITYGGAPIQAVFFSSAAGRTEDAVAVWGSAVPYLVGVDSPEGEADVPNYHSTVTLAAEEFRAIFLDQYPGADLSGTPADWFGERTLTASGAVASVAVGGIDLKGTRVRTLFGLRSAHFSVEPGEDSVTFQVTGYGHGVGMSQYGAQTLARQGKNYQEILNWYYTGVEIG